MTPETVSFFARLALAWRVIVDVAFALRVQRGAEAPALPPAPGVPAEKPAPRAPPPPEPLVAPGTDGALALLSLLQREGRLVDFLKQDVSSFGDADVGAAARVVHDGCRKALLAHVDVDPIRAEKEGSTVTLDAGFDGNLVKLVGNVAGSPPYRGVLRHAGWRARQVRLPERVAGHDPRVLAPAEVEL